MPVSADALFHFTSNINIVYNILRNGFYPRYCMEKKDFLNKHFRDSASPMVCFCDIPLKLAAKHARRYGKFGIGIDKQWAIGAGLHPVLYALPKSSILKYINYSYSALRKYHPITTKKESRNKDLYYLHGEALDAIHFIKSYEGKNWNETGFYGEKIPFYDEREWRFVPGQADMLAADVQRFLSRDLYMDAEEREELNRRLELCSLRINYNTIEYIIVSKEEEITSMIDFIMGLNNICGYELSSNEKNNLCAKIIAMERIEADF